MPPLVVFALIALLALAAVLAAVLPVFFKKTRRGGGEARRENIAAAREQLAAARAQAAGGNLDKAAAAEYEAEIARRLLDETGGRSTADAAEDEIENSPKTRRGNFAAAVFVALAVSLGASVLYAVSGSPQFLQEGGPRAPVDLEAAAQVLQRRLAEKPDDLQAQILLGAVMTRLGRAEEAKAAYARADELAAAMEEKEERELKTPPAPLDGDSSVSDSGTSASGVQVAVFVSEKLQSELAKTQTIFIFARAAEGPRAPLAARRVTAAQLPLTLRLDDGAAMMPAFKMSGFSSYVIVARASQSGDARAGKGDLYGEAPARAGETITLHINRRVTEAAE